MYFLKTFIYETIHIQKKMPYFCQLKSNKQNTWLDLKLFCKNLLFQYWADDKQSKARNSDSKYRQMALVGFDT